MSRPKPHARPIAVLAALALLGALPLACSSAPAATDPYRAGTATATPSAPGHDEMVAGTTTPPRTLAEAETSLGDAEQQLDKLIGTSPQPSPLSTDGCVTVCKVLASIKNAAAHVCSLSADEPARCESAKSRAEKAEERAKSACPSCSES